MSIAILQLCSNVPRRLYVRVLTSVILFTLTISKYVVGMLHTSFDRACKQTRHGFENEIMSYKKKKNHKPRFVVATSSEIVNVFRVDIFNYAPTSKGVTYTVLRRRAYFEIVLSGAPLS